MSFLDPILNPLLSLPSLWLIILMTFFIALLTTLVYKFFTDQALLKSLKERIKKHQGEMKKHKDNPKKVMSIQKEAMSVNMKYMTHSMRSTLITLVPIILIFGWLNAHLVYEPVGFDETFNVTATFHDDVSRVILNVEQEGLTIVGGNSKLVQDKMATWQLKSPPEGSCEDPCSFILRFEAGNNTYTKEVLISKAVYAPVVEDYDEVSIRIEYNKLKPLNFVQIPWVNNWGWLGTYILFSLIFSIALKKILKVY